MAQLDIHNLMSTPVFFAPVEINDVKSLAVYSSKGERPLLFLLKFDNDAEIEKLVEDLQNRFEVSK